MIAAHSPQYVDFALFFALQASLELLQRELLEVHLRGSGGRHRRNLDAGQTVDRCDLHGVADRDELKIDLAFLRPGHGPRLSDSRPKRRLPVPERTARHGRGTNRPERALLGKSAGGPGTGLVAGRRSSCRRSSWNGEMNVPVTCSI